MTGLARSGSNGGSTCLAADGTSLDDELVAANRAVLRAIECPPDTGREAELDALAATLASRASADGPRADAGCCRRLEVRLAGLAAEAPPRRADELRQARRHVDRYAAGLEPIR